MIFKKSDKIFKFHENLTKKRQKPYGQTYRHSCKHVRSDPTNIIAMENYCKNCRVNNAHANKYSVW